MKSKITIVLILMALIVLALCSTVNATQTQLTQTKAKIEEAKQQKAEVKEEMSEVMVQIQTLTTSISESEAKIDELQISLNALEKEITEATEKIRISQENYDKKKAVFEERLVAMSEMGDTTFLDVILNSSSISDFISNWYMIKEISNKDTELMQQLEKERLEIESAKAELETKQTKVKESKLEIEKSNLVLKNSKSKKDQYMTQLSEEEKTLQQQIDSYESEVSRIQAAMRRASSSGGNYVKYTGGVMAWPTRITKRVNSVYAPNGRTDIAGGRAHMGVDIYAPSGTPLYSVADGQVITINGSGYGGGYGLYVVVAHGNGVYTLYAHGSAIGNISVGSTVTSDTIIMYAGNTGHSYGAHLHFEVWEGQWNKVNPCPYLGIENREGYVM